MAKGLDSEKWKAWHSRLAGFETSGMKVADFCRQDGISEPSFYYWKRRLRELVIVSVRKRSAAYSAARLRGVGARPLDVFNPDGAP